ncbi:unnamed protein product [Ectocarpus fasciculatus]
MLRSTVALLSASSVLGWDDVILPPPASKTGPVVALYYGQGADIKTDQYAEILGSLQQAVDFPLWVGIPQCPGDAAAVPNALKNGIERIRDDMKEQGMIEEFSFYGGHSLGGAMMPDYVYANAADTAAGVMLSGSFLTRKYKTGKTAEGRPQYEFPVPTLTIGGELDGLCRISRVAEALYTQISFSQDPEVATLYMPVTTISGMNHMQFASGEVPTFVLENDLQAEVSEEEAQAMAVADMTSFMGSILFPQDASYAQTLQKRVQESTEFTQPIVDALLMESYEQFLPGCYCETEDEYGYLQYGTCASTPSCVGGVRWTDEHAQRLMGGLDDARVVGLDMTVADSIHLVTEEDPSCHLPHIHGNPENSANPGHDDTPPICEQPNGCLLNITTVTQHVYENGHFDIWRLHFDLDWADTGYLPLSSKELKTKIKSRQAVWEAAGVKNVSYVETDVVAREGGTGDRCKEINQAAIDWAISKAPETTRSRFDKYGQKLIVGEDLGTCAAGPCWIWDPLRFDKDDEANTVNVQAVWFGSENQNAYPCGEDKTIPCSAGFHYCKLLSPSRALEWMYVDGLRNKLGTDKL